MADARDDRLMRYEHLTIRGMPVERRVMVPVERRVIVVDPEDVMEGALPADTGEPYVSARPDFARGQEADPARLQRFVEDRFSRGLERNPWLHQQVHQGDFATGLAALSRHPEVELRGRFARGQQLSDPGNPNEERLAS
jgi:hypothetical protein